jgi:hypothetical protein
MMNPRCVVLVFDACVDSWWFHCEPVVAINVGCLMTWISQLNDPLRELVPLKVFPLLSRTNSMGWSRVYVVVVASRPSVRTFLPPSVSSLVFDLGLPRGWHPGCAWPVIPLDVHFYWELAAGSCSVSVDPSATLRSFTRPYHTHSPPAVMRQEWRELAAPVSSPCTPSTQAPGPVT